MAVITHNRNSAAGPSLPDTKWPEANMDINNPGTWGNLHFGIPTYSPPTSRNPSTTRIRQDLNGAVVPDAAVGGFTLCPTPPDMWESWGNWNESFYIPYYMPDRSQFNISNEARVVHWPCFSKYYVTFPLNNIPAGKIIRSAALKIFQFGNAGDYPGGAPQPSFIQVLRVDNGWNENTITWNNAPYALENYGGSWVGTLNGYPGVDGVARTWDVSRLVAEMYAMGRPVSMALYSSDWDMDSGKYFYSSDYWNHESRPTLEVIWGDP